MLHEKLELKNQLCFKLYSASRAMTRLYNPILQKLELTYPQYLVMLVLWEMDVISFKELSNKLTLKTGTLTPIMVKLEKQNLIIKKINQQDERKLFIELSDKGRKLRDKAEEIPSEIGCRIKLKKEEYEKYMKDLDEILNKLYESENEK